MSDQRMFPIQAAFRNYPRSAAPLSIPWSVAEKAFGAYASRYGRSQSLERLAERGGFGVEEMDDLYPAWREEVSEIARLRAALAEARAQSFSGHDWNRLLGERDAALAAKEGAEREVERRTDCHAGPGTTEPACGGCVSCLSRDLDASERAVSALKAEVEAAEKRAAASHRHAEAEAHAHDGTIRERNEARAAASALRERAEDLATALTILCDLHQNAVGVAWDEARRLIAAAPPHEET